jgi:hypothetical protein
VLQNYGFRPEDHPDDWSHDYSHRDHELVDYQYYALPQIAHLRFRGPQVPAADLASGNYFSCVGGAQTHGVYIQKPYPNLLADKLNIPALNLSLGGCGPGVYVMAKGTIELINRGRFVIMQVMTARTDSNSRMAPYGFVEAVRDMKNGGEPISAGAMWARVLKEEPDRLALYISESQASWRQRYRDLIGQITVPIILFYFAHKPPDEPIDTSSWERLIMPFPQLVDAASIEDVKSLCDLYVECRSKRNFGHALISRFTGKQIEVDYADISKRLEYVRGYKVNINDYYPSPEMHEDAAIVTEAAVRELAKRKVGILS